MHSSFTIIRNDSNLKPLLKTSSHVTLGIIISIASLLCAVEQTAELDSQWNVLPEASDSRLSLLFRGNGFVEAVLHPRWGKRNSESYFKCTQRLLGTFTVISWTVMLHLVSEMLIMHNLTGLSKLNDRNFDQIWHFLLLNLETGMI